MPARKATALDTRRADSDSHQFGEPITTQLLENCLRQTISTLRNHRARSSATRNKLQLLQFRPGTHRGRITRQNTFVQVTCADGQEPQVKDVHSGRIPLLGPSRTVSEVSTDDERREPTVAQVNQRSALGQGRAHYLEQPTGPCCQMRSRCQ